MFKRKVLPCLIAAGIVAIAGCNKGGPGGSGPGTIAADDPLTYVPADTPYVIANIDPQPKDVSDGWIAKIDKAGKLGDIYAAQIDSALKAIADTDASCAGAAPATPAMPGIASPADSDANGGGGGGAMQEQANDPATSAQGDNGAPAAAMAIPPTMPVDGEASPADASSAATAATGGMTDDSGDADKCAATSVAQRAKATKLLGAVKDEVAGKDSKALMDTLGLSPQAHMAFYGIGLVPVIRVELAKPENLRATIGRIEAKSGTKLDTGKVGGLDYWAVRGDASDAKLEGVFAISGKQFVATIAPGKPSDADLRTLFGLDKPKQSLADSGGLAALNKKMNYLTYGSGYFDSARLVAILKAAPTPLETSFLAAIGEKKPQIDATCAAEYDQLAAAWPRASFGYTDLSTQHMGLRGVLEARADIAKDLMTLRAPMPGMGAVKDSLANFGFSINLAKLPDLATQWADATAKSPWKCPALANLNAAAEKGKTTLSNPGVAGYAGMFHGFHLLADKIDMKDGQPIPDFSGIVVLGSDNPASLLAMAGNMVPGIATLGLKDDGAAKPLPAIPNLPLQGPMFAAMTKQALAIAIGQGEDAKIAAAMKSDPAQQPLFTGGGRGELYHLLANVIRKSAQSLGDPAKQKELEQQAKMMDMYAGFFKRADVTVELTEQGIELHESVDVAQ